MAVGQNVPEGGEVVNPTARTPLGVRGVRDRHPPPLLSPEGGQQQELYYSCATTILYINIMPSSNKLEKSHNYLQKNK